MSNEPDWYTELADALKSRKRTPAQISNIVAEARAHCTASGEHPQDAFGDPHTFAADITSNDEWDDTRFQGMAEHYNDLQAPVAYRLLASFGLLLACFGLYGWLILGTWRTLSPAEQVTWLLSVPSLTILTLRSEARRAGHLSTARRYLIAWLVFVTASIAASTFWTPPPLRVAFPPFLLAGVGLTALGWWLTRRWTKAHPPVTRLPADVWLDQLASLLEGRYDLTASQAREFRAEAAAHLAESGGDPEQEFGPVEDYAAELVERSGLNRRRGSTWLLLIVFTVFFVGAAAYVISEVGFLNLRSAILLVVAYFLVQAVVDKAFRHYRTTPAKDSTPAESPDQR